MCSSLRQLALGLRDLFQAEENSCYVKLRKLKKKVTLKIVLDEQSCHFS